MLRVAREIRHLIRDSADTGTVRVDTVVDLYHFRWFKMGLQLIDANLENCRLTVYFLLKSLKIWLKIVKQQNYLKFSYLQFFVFFCVFFKFHHYRASTSSTMFIDERLDIILMTDARIIIIFVVAFSF